MTLSTFIRDQGLALLQHRGNVTAATAQLLFEASSQALVADILLELASRLATSHAFDGAPHDAIGPASGRNASPLGAAVTAYVDERSRVGMACAQILDELESVRIALLAAWARTRRDGEDALDALMQLSVAWSEVTITAANACVDRLEDAHQLRMAALAHDLRVPLAAINISASVLQRTARFSDASAALRVQDGAARMLELVDGLLDFSQLQRGALLPMQCERVDLVPIARASVGEVRALHPARSITLNARGPLEGDWDGKRLGQLISHLLVNALTHGGPDSPVTLSLLGHESHAELAVHNVGEPIPADLLEVIFEPLTRGTSDSGLRSGKHGAGLGLFTFRAIAVAHGGDVSAASTPASGTVFSVRLPFLNLGAPLDVIAPDQRASAAAAR
ncbi:sensor histidine kinase [soil metagenome]